MKKLLCFCLLCFAGIYGYAQKPTIRQQLENDQEDSTILLHKARQLLMDKFYDGAIGDVQEVKKYILDELENAEIYGLWPGEVLLLDYRLGNYRSILYYTQHLDSLSQLNQTRTAPPEDDLFSLLATYFILNREAYEFDIDQSQLSSEEKDFLKLTLKFLLLDSKETFFTQKEINTDGEVFEKKYPESRYLPQVNNYCIRIVRSPFAASINVGIGCGVFTGRMSDYLRSTALLNLSLDFWWKKYYLSLDMNIGGGKLSREMAFSQTIWPEDSRTTFLTGGLHLGYVFFEKGRHRLTPFVSYNGIHMAPTEDDKKENEKLKKVGIDFAPCFGGGIGWDFNLPKWSYRNDNSVQMDTYLRLQYQCSYIHHSTVRGTMHSITFSILFKNRKIKIQ